MFYLIPIFIFLIFIQLSCERKKINEPPSLNIYLPIENSTFKAIDTFEVKATATDDNAKNIRFSLYIADNNLQAVNTPLVYNFSGNFATLQINYILNERWLNSGSYYLVVTASDDELITRQYARIQISSIPKKLIGYVVGVKSNSGCDIYIGDTNFVFTKQFSTSNSITGNFNSYSKLINIVTTDGKLKAYQYPYFNEVFSIVALNKIGSPFKADIYDKYPYTYVTNANGSIISVDHNGQIRNIYRTLFSPYRLILWEEIWVCLTEFYPQQYSWIEVPQMTKNYQNNYPINDIIPFDNERCLAIQQDGNQVIFYTYKPEINYFNSFGHPQSGQYNGGININQDVYVSIDTKIFQIDPIYGNLSNIYNGEPLSMLKWEENEHNLYAVNNNRFIMLKWQPLQLIYSKDFDDKIIFYDFIYE